MFQARGAHHQERPNCINSASGNCHSVLVAVSCDGWEFTPNHHISPDDEHHVLETCREFEINK
jgi:hypothetical protein